MTGPAPRAVLFDFSAFAAHCLADLVDATVLSFEVGAAKPDPQDRLSTRSETAVAGPPPMRDIHVPFIR